MSKKSRRSRAKRRAKPVRATQGEHHIRPQPAIESYQSSTPRSFEAPRPFEAPSSLDRYRYIMPELRRIGIIAGSILLILVALSFGLG